MGYVETCAGIARIWHAGMVDLAGEDYFAGHLTQVAKSVEKYGEDAVCVAYLHDILEDTDLSITELSYILRSTISDEYFLCRVVEAVSAMTKYPSEKYDDYLDRVYGNNLARIVKIADLEHNSDLSRLPSITDRDLRRNEKYSRAISFLNPCYFFSEIKL